jgi:hypothetical protein
MALKLVAKAALTAVVGPFVEEAREAALNAAQGMVRSKLAGRMSIEEWAGIVIECVDNVKARAIDEGNLRYIGGKLKFSISENAQGIVVVSFQLYFQDDFEKWHKAEADSDLPVSVFTPEALEELETKGEVVYEVE